MNGNNMYNKIAVVVILCGVSVYQQVYARQVVRESKVVASNVVEQPVLSEIIVQAVEQQIANDLIDNDDNAERCASCADAAIELSLQDALVEALSEATEDATELAVVEIIDAATHQKQLEALARVVLSSLMHQEE